MEKKKKCEREEKEMYDTENRIDETRWSEERRLLSLWHEVLIQRHPCIIALIYYKYTPIPKIAHEGDSGDTDVQSCNGGRWGWGA